MVTPKLNLILAFGAINKFSSLIPLLHNPKGPSVASFARQERNFSTGPTSTVNYNDSNNESIEFNINPWFVTGLYDAEKKSLVV